MVISELLLSKQTTAKIKYDKDKLPMIHWNYTKILLLFKNLIENGIKYNNKNTPTINIYSIESKENVKIYIEDNGIGIEKEYFYKIFVMFNRLHNQKIYEGTGLGLATCKKIVSDFSGTITVKSKIDEGSVFVLSFPSEMIVKNAINNQAGSFDNQQEREQALQSNY